MPGDQEPLRDFLIREVQEFVTHASRLAGVRSIALLGSLTTPKKHPKDADLLVRVDDGMHLKPLARVARGLQGRAQSRSSGADIFIADADNQYQGRICRFRDCRPGIRVSCAALHCGRKPHLCDDLQLLTLGTSLLRAPPVELWPQAVTRAPIPADIEALLTRLDAAASSS